MSKVYTECKVYCPCFEEELEPSYGDTKTKLPLMISHNGANHDIGDLFFCPTCQGHKCTACCQANIESKYCSNCMTDYTESNEVVCTKSCFSCPLCDSGLTISAIDSLCDDKDGKIFKFKCLYCEYQYSTATILKPRSLVSIIRSEKNSRDGGYASLFAKFREKFVDQQTLMKLENDQHKKKKNVPQLSSEVMKKLKDLELSNLADSMTDSSDEIEVLKNKINQNGLVTIDENQDMDGVSQIASKDCLGDFVNLVQQSKYNNFYSTISNGSIVSIPNKILNPKAADQVPIPKKLVSKISYTCLKCGQILLMPHKEPSLIKLLTKWNAIDFLPMLRISSLINKEYPKSLQIGKLYDLLINVINPLPVDIDMVITTMSQVSLEFLSDPLLNLQVTLPVSRIKIRGQKQKKDPNSIVKSIPTPFLTKNTKLSRTELIMRLGKLNSARNCSDDSFEVPDITVDKGDNWCLMPFNISVESSDLQNPLASIQIPFYITIKSQVPESIQNLKVPNLHLSYGFWTVINFGNFLIES